jgi:hypothetical protein
VITRETRSTTLDYSSRRAGIQKRWHFPWLISMTIVPMLAVMGIAVALLTLVAHLDSDDEFSRALVVAVTAATIGAAFAIVGSLRDLFTMLLKRQQTAARLWAKVTSDDGDGTSWDDEAVTEVALFVIDAARRRADEVGHELMRLRCSGDVDRDGECARVLKALMSPEMRRYFELRDS